jgi:hypothetical protein
VPDTYNFLFLDAGTWPTTSNGFVFIRVIAVEFIILQMVVQELQQRDSGTLLGGCINVANIRQTVIMFYKNCGFSGVRILYQHHPPTLCATQYLVVLEQLESEEHFGFPAGVTTASSIISGALTALVVVWHFF